MVSVPGAAVALAEVALGAEICFSVATPGATGRVGGAAFVEAWFTGAAGSAAGGLAGAGTGTARADTADAGGEELLGSFMLGLGGGCAGTSVRLASLVWVLRGAFEGAGLTGGCATLVSFVRVSAPKLAGPVGADFAIATGAAGALGTAFAFVAAAGEGEGEVEVEVETAEG